MLSGVFFGVATVVALAIDLIGLILFNVDFSGTVATAAVIEGADISLATTSETDALVSKGAIDTGTVFDATAFDVTALDTTAWDLATEATVVVIAGVVATVELAGAAIATLTGAAVVNIAGVVIDVVAVAI